MKTVHKNTVKAVLRKGQTWKGYIAPSNVNSFHVIGGWSLGMKVEFTDLAQMEEVVSEFKFWNCQEAELGKRVRFWED